MLTKERLEEIKQRLIANKEHRHENMIAEYNNMQPFESVADIPEPPVTDMATYYNVIVPNLIRCGAIPKKDLVKGKTYYGSCRNANEGMWNGIEFVIVRYKFGSFYDSTVKHFEDWTPYDVFVPIEEKNYCKL